MLITPCHEDCDQLMLRNRSQLVLVEFHYNFTASEVWTRATEGPPPQKEEKTGH